MEQLIEELKAEIKKLHDKCGDKYDLSPKALERLHSVSPFNKFEYVMSHLIAEGIVNLDQYFKIRNTYLEKNKYLSIFEMTAPRTFGETWGQKHLNELVSELKRPSKKYDSTYDGDYDFWYDSIRIEVKASRVVKKKSGGSLVDKALSIDSPYSFEMNFQQIKPKHCDVFVWVGVWRDTIKYWVLSSNNVESNKYFSKGQHRGNNGEGQLWITNKNIKDFESYLSEPKDILDKIIQQAAKQKEYDEKNCQLNLISDQISLID